MARKKKSAAEPAGPDDGARAAEPQGTASQASGNESRETGWVSRPLDERERQIDDDYKWSLRSPEVQRAYAGKVVAVYRRRVWRAGKNHRLAGRAARRKPGCPPREIMAYVYIEGYALGTAP